MTVNSPSQSLPSNPEAQPSIVCLSLGCPASYFVGRCASPLVLLDGVVITTTLPQVFVLFALIFFSYLHFCEERRIASLCAWNCLYISL